MISKRLISLIAVAVVVSLVGAFVAAQRADAAIGVVRWWPEQVNPQQVKVHYRLNLTATSGKIEIFNASNALVKTITLAGADLARGNHEVLWDGTQDPSGVAPTGNYYAKITVSKGAVAEPGATWRIRDHSVQAPLTHRYFGIDADNNPANNNQTTPAASTFGNIYINNTVSRYIEPWLPGEGPAESTGDYAIQLFGALDLPGWTSGWTAGSAPWGVAVGREGRVYSINRSVMSFANYKFDGSDLKRTVSSNQLGNTRDTDVISGPSGIFQAVVSSSDKFGIKPVKPDYSYTDSYSDSKILGTGYGVENGQAQGIGLGDETADLMNSVFYVAVANQKWVKRWTVTGTGYADIAANPDGAFVLNIGTDIANGPTDVAVSPKIPDIAVVTRGASPNIEVWNLTTQAKVREIPIGTGGASKVAFDAWGNALVTQGTYLAGVWAFMVELPDTGSSDTVQTIQFPHQGGNTPPVIDSISFTVGASAANKLPLDDSTTTDVTVRVRDVDGSADITQVCLDLALLGYPKDCTPDSQTSVDANTVDYKFLGVKAKGNSRAGVINLPAEAKDSQNHLFTATKALYTSGGTLTGVVTHNTGGFPVEGVNVSATDGTNVYTGSTGAGGAYSLEVNPGSFVVTASKAGYGAGTPSSPTSIVIGASNSPAVDATVGSITIAQFRALNQGVKACVEAVVSAANYTPASTAWKRPKGYLRDSSGSNSNGLATPTNNLGLRFYAPSATYAEGDKVVVEGEKTLAAFGELMIDNVTNFAKSASGQAYPDADVAVADDINDNVNNTLDNRWGSLVRLAGVTVAAVTPDANANYHTLTVSDASSTIVGQVLIWKNTGITAGDLPAVGAVVDITGVISRHESDLLAERWNVLEPRKLADIQSAIVDVASVGDARSKADGTTVNLIGASVVTLKSNAEAGVFYMQSGGSGIRVVMPSGGTAPEVFATVKVKGRIGTDANGERVIQNAEVTPVATDTTVNPVNVINRSVGGKGYQGPAGVENYGLVNQGLLVRVFGKVTDSDFISSFWLDDGSAVDGQDGTHTGIKVLKAEVFPSPGDYISVVGVVSSEIVGGKKIRVLRGREGLNPDPDYSDVETLAP